MKTAPGFQSPEMFEQYRRLNDDELERLLEDFDNLLPAAQSCLIAELQTRGQTNAAIAATADAGRKHKLPLTSIDGFDPDLTRKIGNVRSFHGIGRTFFGKAHSTYNEVFAYEEFDTSLWCIFMGIPVVPMGSFRIRRKEQGFDHPRAFGPYSFVVVQQVPFLWLQNILPLTSIIALLSLGAYSLIMSIVKAILRSM